jgi:hypothetical protein
MHNGITRDLPAEAATAVAAQTKVDCYVLYRADPFQPGTYLADDVDPNIYFSAPVSRPFKGYLEGLFTLEEGNGVGRSGTLREFYRVPGEPLPMAGEQGVADFYCGQQHHDLYRSFSDRENVRSIAAFMDDAPPRGKLPSVVFFSFRAGAELSRPDLFGTDRRFSAQGKALLRHRAARALTQSYARGRREAAEVEELSRMNARVSKLWDKVVLELLGTPGELDIDRVLRELLQQIESVFESPGLAEAGPAAGDARPAAGAPQLIVTSVHEFRRERDAAGGRPTLQLVRLASDLANVASQDCSSPAHTSITTCTAMTGRSHLLQYIDDCDRGEAIVRQTSVRLADDVAREINALLAAHEFDGLDVNFRQPWRPRLVVSSKLRKEWVGGGQGGRAAWRRAFNRMRDHPFGCRWPGLVDKLEARAWTQYADLYVELKPGFVAKSEVCVPITFARQVIGCLNVESARPYEWNHFELNAFHRIAEMIGLVMSRRMDLQLLSTIHKTLEQIHRGGDDDEEAARLVEFATQVKRLALCDDVDFHVDATPDAAGAHEYVRFARSDDPGFRDDHRPRGGGWTHYVAAQNDPAAVGVVLRVNPPRRPGEPVDVADAWDVLEVENDDRVDRDDRDHRDDRGVGRPARRLTLRKIPDLDVPERVLAGYDGVRPRLLVGLKLKASVSSDGRHGTAREVVGVMWCAHVHHGSVYCAGGDNEKLLHYLRHVRSIAGICSIVPLTWHSRLRESQRMLNLATHGNSHGSLTCAVENLKQLNASPHARALPPTELADLRDALVYAEELDARARLVYWVKPFMSQGEMATYRSHHATRLDLRQVVDEALFLCQRTPDQIARKPYELSGVDGVEVFAPRCALREILINIFKNSIAHGRGPGPVAVLTVRWDSPGSTLVVGDLGPGLGRNRPGWMRSDGADPDTALARVRVGKTGHGLAWIFCLARLVGGAPPEVLDSTGDRRGLEWRIRLNTKEELS